MMDMQTDALDQPVGKAKIVQLKQGPGLSVMVFSRMEGRRGLPTLVSFRMLDTTERLLGHGTVTVVPDSDVHEDRSILRASLNVLKRHRIWRQLMEMGRFVCARWDVEIRDAEGRLLEASSTAYEYEKPAYPRDGRPDGEPSPS